jgi:WD40 repeat protein
MADQSPVPRSILRGHKAQVHAAVFIRGNKRLVTGDAEGFVIVWDLTILRARAVWKAHQKAILGIREWGTDKIITFVIPTILATARKPDIYSLTTPLQFTFHFSLFDILT